MTQAKAGDKVKIHYTGTLDDGTQFDSSAGKEPLAFELGGGQVIPGFDKAVEGMAVGEKKSVRIDPEDAYGERDDNLTQAIARTALPPDVTPEPGMTLQGQGPDGQVILLTVAAVNEDNIMVDANHPLAGRALTFEIELVEIS